MRGHRARVRAATAATVVECRSTEEGALRVSTSDCWVFVGQLIAKAPQECWVFVGYLIGRAWQVHRHHLCWILLGKNHADLPGGNMTLCSM